MMSLAVGVNTAGDSPLRWLPGHFSPYLLRAFECGAREAVGGQTSDGTAVKLLSGHASPLQRHRRDAPAEATDPSQGTRRPGWRWVSLRGATPTRTLSKIRSRWWTALSLTGCRARPSGVSTWSLGRWWFFRRPPNMVHCGGWRGTGLLLLVGDDWAEDHHDVEVQAESGRVLGKAKLPEGIAGIARLHALIGGQVGEDDESVQVVVGIETERGPWVQALVAAGYQVYPINPLQVARYRERHGVSGAKSDAGDAHTLADMVRTDRHQPQDRPHETQGAARRTRRLTRTHRPGAHRPRPVHRRAQPRVRRGSTEDPKAREEDHRGRGRAEDHPGQAARSPHQPRRPTRRAPRQPPRTANGATPARRQRRTLARQPAQRLPTRPRRVPGHHPQPAPPRRHHHIHRLHRPR